ncbi:MAG: hypothetical protein JXX29_17770 [Deltaproteobacteria bacterium]|nr:hypothetical protein [Deltaproteobacteria bacterium]
MNHTRTTIFFVSSLLTLFVLATILQNTSKTRYEKISSEVPLYYLPGTSWLTFFSLGYNEAFADAVWTKFIVYFSEAPKTEVKQGEFLNGASDSSPEQPLLNHSVNYVLAATSLDTHFLDAYMHGARLTLYHRGKISRDTVEMAIDVLKQGIRYFPENGDMLFHLGFLYYYEYPPFAKDNAEKDKMKDLGINYIQKSANTENAPPITTLLATSLATKHQMTELIVQHLQNQLLIEKDPDVRETIIEKLKKQISILHDEDLAQIEHLYQRWQHHYSDIPFDIFTLLYFPELGDHFSAFTIYQ